MIGGAAVVRFVLAAALVLFAAARPAAAATPQFPALTGRVVDAAHVLPAQVAADLTAKLEALEAKTSRQLVVVTVPSLQGYEIEEYGYQLGRAWGIGQKTLNNGALLIVAPNERRVRVEVGYGLEGVLTDALSSVILQTQVLPKFRAGDLPGGVVAGTDALIEQLSADPTTAEQRAAAAAQSQRQEEKPDPISLILLVLFVIFVLRAMLGRRRGLGAAGVFIPPIIFGGGSRRSGWGGGGGFGGGGFGGGGGSFGGGGSSGSW